MSCDCAATRIKKLKLNQETEIDTIQFSLLSPEQKEDLFRRYAVLEYW